LKKPIEPELEGWVGGKEEEDRTDGSRFELSWFGLEVVRDVPDAKNWSVIFSLPRRGVEPLGGLNHVGSALKRDGFCFLLFAFSFDAVF